MKNLILLSSIYVTVSSGAFASWPLMSFNASELTSAEKTKAAILNHVASDQSLEVSSADFGKIFIKKLEGEKRVQIKFNLSYYEVEDGMKKGGATTSKQSWIKKPSKSKLSKSLTHQDILGLGAAISDLGYQKHESSLIKKSADASGSDSILAGWNFFEVKIPQDKSADTLALIIAYFDSCSPNQMINIYVGE